MKLLLTRHRYTATATFGRLYVDGVFQCFTLEDTVRPTGIKVKNDTAIPAGEYKVSHYVSPRFKRVLPIIYTEDDGVTLKSNGIEFRYTLFHSGNKIEDTSGCVLVGEVEKVGYIENSRKAETALMKKLKGNENITLEIINLIQAS